MHPPLSLFRAALYQLAILYPHFHPPLPFTLLVRPLFSLIPSICLSSSLSSPRNVAFNRASVRCLWIPRGGCYLVVGTVAASRGWGGVENEDGEMMRRLAGSSQKPPLPPPTPPPHSLMLFLSFSLFLSLSLWQPHPQPLYLLVITWGFLFLTNVNKWFSLSVTPFLGLYVQQPGVEYNPTTLASPSSPPPQPPSDWVLRLLSHLPARATRALRLRLTYTRSIWYFLDILENFGEKSSSGILLLAIFIFHLIK